MALPDQAGLEPPGGIDVWAIELDHQQLPLDRFEKLLSGDERARAHRFHLRGDRDRYLSGRGQLRLLLAAYLGTHPAAVRFSYNANGKPALVGAPALDFNLSHSEGQAVLAVTAGRTVGVDIERMRTGFAAEAIAERFFSTAEIAAWRSLPVADQERAFFACWTRKEAFVKAKGGGLAIPLDAFSVTLGPDEPPALVWSAQAAPPDAAPPDAAPSIWSFEDLSSWFPGHAVAVAVAGPAIPVLFRALPENAKQAGKEK